MFVLYFLLMMVPIVVIHELGHFYIGKWSGIRPEIFSVGFGPELWRRTAKDGTIWRVGALPFGGYVKFANDENGTSFPNMDVSKSKYLASYGAKIATLFAGPFANFLLSILIFFIYAASYGPQAGSKVIERAYYTETEFQKGDEILSVNGKTVGSFINFFELTQSDELFVEVVVDRGDQNIALSVMNPNAPVIVGLDPSLEAFKQGVEMGDLIVAINDKDVTLSSDAVELIVENGDQMLQLGVLRNGEKLSFDILPKPVELDDGTLSPPRVGVNFGSFYETAHEALGFAESWEYAWRSTFWIITASWDGIRDLVTGRVGIDAMSGPVGIGQMAEESAGYGLWNFIWMMGIMSSAIGFLNLLPMPILDGGHIVLITYERIFGKLPPQSFLNVIFALGFTLLMGLMLYTTTRELFG